MDKGNLNWLNRKTILSLSIGFVGAFLSVTVLLPLCNRFRRRNDDDIKRLHKIGIALSLYEHENHGALPNKLEDLVESGDLSPDMLKSQAANSEDGSNIYLRGGKNIRDLDANDAVVIDEASTNHDGGNVLLSDGTSVYVDAEGLKYVLKNGRIESLVVNGQHISNTRKIPSTAS